VKKKILAAILVTTLLIAGCGNKQDTYSEQEKSIVKVENNIGYSVYVDKDTGVMYLSVDSGYGGGITVMINEDGTPKIWQGEK
jgi:PBP1b-binding outer membrane lipoprotein LpoB